jgi:hypothetical protein
MLFNDLSERNRPMSATHLQANKPIRLFSVFACCLMSTHLAFQRVCVGPTVTVHTQNTKISVSTLAKSGLLFTIFTRSNIVAYVFVREAPMVVRYQLGSTSTATLTITAKVKKDVKTFPLRLEPTGNEMKERKFHLPADFGNKALVGVLSIKADNIDPTNKQPPDFEFGGICMGEKACGSLGADCLGIQPDHIRAGQHDKAAYSFFFRFDFEKIFMEVRPVDSADPVYKKQIDGVRRGDTMPGEWDGKDKSGKVSKGRYQVGVNASDSPKNGADYTFAPCTQRIIVE